MSKTPGKKNVHWWQYEDGSGMAYAGPAKDMTDLELIEFVKFAEFDAGPMKEAKEELIRRFELVISKNRMRKKDADLLRSFVEEMLSDPSSLKVRKDMTNVQRTMNDCIMRLEYIAGQ